MAKMIPLHVAHVLSRTLMSQVDADEKLARSPSRRNRIRAERLESMVKAALDEIRGAPEAHGLAALAEALRWSEAIVGKRREAANQEKLTRVSNDATLQLLPPNMQPAPTASEMACLDDWDVFGKSTRLRRVM